MPVKFDTIVIKHKYCESVNSAVNQTALCNLYKFM